MKELIKVETNKNNEQVVSGRELHEKLNIDSNYTTWFKRMCEYGFTENVDFIELWSDSKNGNAVKFEGSAQRMSAKGYEVDHILKLDMAKEISMIQRSEIGKKIRQYFIEVEKKFRNPKPMSVPEQLLAQAKLMVEMDERITSTEDSVKRLEHNIRRNVTNDHVTVIAYTNLNNINPKSYNSSVVGRKASKMCRDENLLIGKVVDSKYGYINTYPSNVLDRVFKSMNL
ncbi:antA/AntB antirepressor family protein [Peptostreptococcus equinus]|uniref:AntA/AntB antirepressor family protein n=1 Tax=Peptostreptococcus equinus TaxID=3003601 RepID=A0ABY7JSH0_9FIRM|nr:antA/AntB antirepressor family protein [Peptostreptococcus sp. CBA3647]WAW15421.1 antA/AntB antirepressor family protein [Peptostreptococcus sp. CBA3647]